MLVAAGTLAGCSGPGGAGPSPTTLTGFSQPAALALVTQDEVAEIAGPGFQGYRSGTVVANAEPTACLELIRFADGTRTGPASVVSSASESFADGSTGASITNTVHVFADAATATKTFDRLVGEVSRCSSFTIEVNDQLFKAGIRKVEDAPGREASITLRVEVTNPTTSSDVTSVLARTGRALVVAVGGSPDGAGERAWATKTAVLSVGRAANL